MNFGIFPGRRQPGCRECPPGSASREVAPMLHALEEFMDAPKPPGQMSADELGRALAISGRFAAWQEELEAHSLRQLLAGHAIPGWKAVAGKSNRRFTDVDAAFDALARNGIDVAQLYERKPLSLAQVEKTVGKGTFLRIAGSFVERPPGKPTLAPACDPRSPYRAGL